MYTRALNRDPPPKNLGTRTAQAPSDPMMRRMAVEHSAHNLSEGFRHSQKLRVHFLVHLGRIMCHQYVISPQSDIFNTVP